MAVLFIFGFLLTILFNSNLINGAEMGHSISLDPNQADFSQNRMLQQTYRVTCPKRNGNKPCRLNVNTDDSYVISIERGVLFEARFLLESQNSDLNISFISNSPLQPDISVYYGSRRPEYISQIGSSNAVVPKSFIQAYDGGTLFFDLDGFDQPITLTLRMSFIVPTNTSAPTSPPSPVPSTSIGGPSSVNSPSKTGSGSSSQQSGSQDGYLSTEDISGGSLPALIIIIPIAATLMLLCILGIWCYRNKANRQRRNRFAQAQRGRNDQIELILEESEPLTQQNITERFPVAKGEMLENPFGQTTCSICLEEFQKESACRQLYCQHIFHSECIKLWLINQLAKGQAFCPNCNKSVMKKADIEIIRDEI